MRTTYYIFGLVILFLATAWYVLFFSPFSSVQITSISGFSGVLVNSGTVSSNSQTIILYIINKEPFRIILNGSQLSTIVLSPEYEKEPLESLSCQTFNLSSNSSTTCRGTILADGSAMVNLTLGYSYENSDGVVTANSSGSFRYSICKTFAAVC